MNEIRVEDGAIALLEKKTSCAYTKYKCSYKINACKMHFVKNYVSIAKPVSPNSNKFLHSKTMPKETNFT